uniref:Acyl-CoA-binding domain-containing protein 3-like n=1 Tax=Tanacetum cinerariifolium TaxID=118510 RepID=A0A6L2KZ70_TANCI|nr:acyl-CoA-binding domain-containing protein 3-like [Tanacetum cinerariifolium]
MSAFAVSTKVLFSGASLLAPYHLLVADASISSGGDDGCDFFLNFSFYLAQVDWDAGSHGWRQMLRTELMTPDLTCPSTHQLLRNSGGGSEPDVSFDKSASPEHFFTSSSDVDNEKIDNQDWVVCDKNDKGLPFQDDDLGSGVVIDDDDDKVFDEMPERGEVENYVKTDEGNAVECDLGSLLQEDLGSSVADVGEVKVEEEDVICEDDDDDWQGIETTELEKRFGAAVAFMGSKSSGERMDNDVKVELYGLQKVANEGSCFEPQPMALKVSARANWNSWKRLENLGREDAMEQYVALLSRHVPDWMGTHTSDKQ